MATEIVVGYVKPLQTSTQVVVSTGLNLVFNLSEMQDVDGYSGQFNKYARVKTDGLGIEWVDVENQMFGREVIHFVNGAIYNTYVDNGKTKYPFLRINGKNYLPTVQDGISFTITSETITDNGDGTIIVATSGGNKTFNSFDAEAITRKEISEMQILQWQDSGDVRGWGARGDNDQTLYPYTRQVDGNQVVVTHETRDGIAIDSALTFLKNKGGGTLRIPKGIYRIYAYMQDLDFNISIEGDGIDITTLKSCDVSPSTNGYGIFAAYGETARTVTIKDLTLDGNIDARGGGEVRAYPWAAYGRNITVIADRVKSQNSIIDCWYSSTSVDGSCSSKVSNCIFRESHRNTISLVGATNHVYDNCSISGGGTGGTGGGTNPRACLDIEPNINADICDNIVFNNCRFWRAVNQLVINSWCTNVKYNNCTFDGAWENPPENAGVVGRSEYPWLANGGASQVEYYNCTFIKTDTYNGMVRASYNDNDPLTDYAYVKFHNCQLNGAGFDSQGDRTIINNCVSRDTVRASVFWGTAPVGSCEIDGLKLINVVNQSSGWNASLMIHHDFEGSIWANNILITIDALTFPQGLIDVVDPTTYAFYGIQIDTGGITSDAFVKLSNIHVSGYYQQLPQILGRTPNITNFRDWSIPNLAPADTAGQEVFGGTPHYTNCTMRGDR